MTEYEVKPTERHKKAFENMLENGGNRSEAMLKAGYSKTVAKTPSKVTKSKGWQQLLEEYLPDEDLTKKHKEFLNSKKEEVGLKALDLGYKVKGKLIENLNAIQINIGRKSTDKLQDEELNRLMNVFKDETTTN